MGQDRVGWGRVELELGPVFAEICRSSGVNHKFNITGDHSEKDQIFLVKNCKYIGFCVYHRSY